MLMLSALGLPFLLINDGGRSAGVGVLLLAVEGLVAVMIGRKLVRKYSRNDVRKKVLPPVIFLVVYLMGNLLATLAIMSLGRP
jgi:uncharacterized membrane protein YfcA